MRGGEYLDAERLVGLWRSLQRSDRRRTRRKRPPDRRIPGRARQPLAARRTRAFQPRREPQGRRAPFRLSGDLRRLARRSRRASARAPRRGAARIRRRGAKSELLRLLEPVHRASESCAWLKEIVATGEIFHPLRWTAREAMRLLATSRRWSRRESWCECRLRGARAGRAVRPSRRRSDPKRLPSSALRRCSTFRSR